MEETLIIAAPTVEVDQCREEILTPTIATTTTTATAKAMGALVQSQEEIIRTTILIIRIHLQDLEV